MSAALEAGFADPVFGAQAAFRAIMEAMARPGTTQPLAPGFVPPPPLTAELAAVALTLLDQDTPVWLDPELAEADAVCDWLAFHTGAPITPEPQNAAFALVTSAEFLPSFERFNQGTDEYPDRSTTIVLAVPSFIGGRHLTFIGPGIKDSITVSPAGMPEDFVAQRAENRARFPRGTDLLLTAPGAVLGLPRTAES